MEKDVLKFYSGIAPEYDKVFEAAFFNERPVREAVKKYSKGRVLDMGCGNGRWQSTITEMKLDYVGIDINKDLLSIASQKVMGSLMLSDAAKTPFKNESFDTIICLFGVIAHLSKEERKNFCTEVSRLLKSDGTAIIATGNHISPFSLPWMLIMRNHIEMRGNKTRVYNMTKKEFLDMFGNFKCNECRNYDYSFVPIQIIKVVSYLIGADYKKVYTFISDTLQETGEIPGLSWMSKQFYGVFVK